MKRFFLLTSAIFILGMTFDVYAQCQAVDKIEDIVGNPNGYNDKTITVVGKVTEVLDGVGTFKGFEISDENNKTLRVHYVSTLPKKNEIVAVKGRWDVGYVMNTIEEACITVINVTRE